MLQFEEKRSGSNTARILLDPASIAAVQDRDGRVVVTTIGGGSFVLLMDYDAFIEQLPFESATHTVAEANGVYVEDPSDTPPGDFVEAAIDALNDSEEAPESAQLVPQKEETDGGS